MARLSCTIFILSVLIYSCIGQTRFTIQPADATHVVGEQATLRCAVSSPFDKTLHWATGGINEPIFISSGSTINRGDPDRYSVTVDNNIFTLRIKNLEQSDGKVYFCAFYPDGAWKFSSTATLQVIPKWPRPYCTTLPQIASVGDKVTFSCNHFEPDLQLPLTWVYDSLDFGGTETQGRGELFSVERTVQESDNYGHFTCYVGKSISHGDDCTEIPLKIPPNPVVSPEERSRVVGQTAKFSCVPSITHPEVNRYTWIINGTSVGYRTFTEDNGRYHLRDGDVTFKIRDLTLADNQMEVWCKAQNTLGIYAEAKTHGIIYVRLTPESTTHRNSPSKIRPINTEHPGSDATPTTITKSQDLNVDPTNGSNNMGIAIGGSIAAIILIVIIILLTLYLIKDKDFSKFKPRRETLGGIMSVRIERRSTIMKRASTIPSQILLENQARSSTVDQEKDTVIYALPLQKGGGTVKVKTVSKQSLQIDSMEKEIATTESSKCYTKAHRTATLPSGLRGPTEARSGIRGSPSRAKSLSSTSLHSLDSSLQNAGGQEYVLYSLPLQKGGGTMRVRSRNASFESVNRMAESQDSVAISAHDEEDQYAEVHGKDVSKTGESPYAEVQGKDISKAAESPCADVQGKDVSKAADTESPYADLNYDTINRPTSQSLPSLEDKGRLSTYANVSPHTDDVMYEDVNNAPLECQTASLKDYANVTPNSEDFTYEAVNNASSKCRATSERESGYAAINNNTQEEEPMYADVNTNNGESPYVNMSGGSAATMPRKDSDSESEYVKADFAATGCDSFDSVNDDIVNDDPKQLNVEGIIYAEVNLNVGDNSSTQAIGDRPRETTTYADIKNIQS